MYQNPNDAYLESRVLSATPVELVRMLYEGAIGAVREARRHLQSGDIASRSRCISRACDIVAELLGALDRDRGGEIGRNLARLYEYIQARLVEANAQQNDAALAEALALLTTLGEAWQPVEAAPRPQAPVWSVPPEPTGAYASHAWSF